MSVSRQNRDEASNPGGYPGRDPDLPPLPNKYDEFDWEDYGWNHTVTAATLDGTTQTISPAAATFEPLDGDLARNQVAELVYMEVNDAQVVMVEEANAGTTPGVAILEHTIRRDLGATGTDQTPAGPAEYFSNTDDLLYFIRIASSFAFNDTVNGTGGGASFPHQGYVRKHFARDFGVGPLFFQGDELNLSGNLTSYENDNQDIFSYADYRAAWAVHTFDQVEGIFGL